MTPRLSELHEQELGEYVEAFEAAQAAAQAADLAEFLPPPDHPLRAAVLRELVRVDLEYGWKKGRPQRLEDYLRRFPELAAAADALQEAAFEEYRLRRQAGEAPTPDEYRLRFGVVTDGWPTPPDAGRRGPEVPASGARLTAPTHVIDSRPDMDLGIAAVARREFRLDPAASAAASSWCDSAAASAAHADLLRDLHRSDPEAAYRLAQAATTMPEPGTDFLGFRLLDELGRGAFGRVYLAQQGELANRLVALKVSANLLGEPQTLAQLQHTNIVPIYSVHQAGPFQAVCMPYFGATTLADVLKDLGSRESLPASGRGLVSTLNARKSATRVRSSVRPGSDGATATPAPAPPEPAPREAATLHMLEGFTHVQAVLWIGRCLADGLAHAHERGILHRDLKPANVLLTDDGQPMLLDFNLSEDTKLRSNASAALLGGTLPYMAPEHLDAFQGSKRAVDQRSDIYALGVILYELLAGRHPFTVHNGLLSSVLPNLIAERIQGPPDVRLYNRAVTPAGASILRHCLDPDPARRYQSARELREDLDRQLSDRPLRYAPEPSLRERGAKWLRRNPRLAWRLSVVALTVGLVVLTGAFALWKQRADTRERLARAELLQREESEAAAAALARLVQEENDVALLLARQRDGEDALRDEGLRRGRQALAAYGLLDDPAWEERPQVRALPASEQQQLRARLAELAGLLEQTRMLLAKTPGQEAAAQPPLPRGAERLPPRSATERCLEARQLLYQKNFQAARPLLEEAAREDPTSLLVWLLRAQCAEGLGLEQEAAAYYGVCVALWPRAYLAYYARGLLYARQGDHARALADFDRVVELRPDLAEVYVNRALARNARKQWPEALADLAAALERGSQETRIYFLRARIHEALGDREAARRDRDEGLRREPTDVVSWVARGMARLEHEPEQALVDFEQAAKVNPRYPQAWQNQAHVLSEYLHRPADAIRALDRAVALFPDYVPARCGRGVLHARLGQREAALADAREALLRETTPPRLYQAACIYALTSKTHPEDRQEALRLLRQALTRGYGHDLLEKDHDLDPLREDPEFRGLVEAARKLRTPSPPRKTK